MLAQKRNGCQLAGVQDEASGQDLEIPFLGDLNLLPQPAGGGIRQRIRSVLQRFRTPEGEREMRLTLDERADETVSQLRNLPVWTDEGDKIPLAAMADFRLAPGPERIERENRRTGVRVGARYEEGTLNDYLPGVRAALDSMEFPYGYTWTMSEWAEPAPAVARVPGQPVAGPVAGLRGDGRTVRVRAGGAEGW
ncbi:MAG: hypothetical protein GY856_42950 [bacterium]|nr:hypothetical protein [bacterium]